MTTGGNNFNRFPENQLTKNSIEQKLGGPSSVVYPAYPIAPPLLFVTRDWLERPSHE